MKNLPLLPLFGPFPHLHHLLDASSVYALTMKKQTKEFLFFLHLFKKKCLFYTISAVEFALITEIGEFSFNFKSFKQQFSHLSICFL